MPNGERIQFANNINFIFECHSLEFASPATVSRCGMIFLSDEDINAECIVDKWMANNTTGAAIGQACYPVLYLCQTPVSFPLFVHYVQQCED
jgi:hypothetical protein